MVDHRQLSPEAEVSVANSRRNTTTLQNSFRYHKTSSHPFTNIFHISLMLLVVLLFLRYMQFISIYQDIEQQASHSFRWILTEHSPTCFYSSAYFYWKIDTCDQFQIGSLLEITGRVGNSSDDGLMSKKRLMIEDIADLTERSGSDHDWLSKIQQKLAIFRAAVQQKTILLLGADAGGLAVSLVFGTQAHLSEESRHSFELTGTLHILAVSGLHVSLLMSVVDGCAVRLRLGRGKAVFLAASVTAYIALVGFKPSVLRAWAMICVAIAARYVFHRQYHSMLTLCLVAAGLLLFRPDWLLHPGWQLSVAATASILLLGRRFEQFFGGLIVFPEISGYSDALKNWRWMTMLQQSVSISLAAQVVTTPAVLFHFGYTPLLSFIPGSILTIFAAGLLPGLFVGLFGVLGLSLITSDMAALISRPLSLMLDLFMTTVSFLARYDWWMIEYSP